MTGETETKRRTHPFAFRIGRATYWAYILLLVLVSAALGVVMKSSANSGVAVVWILLYAGRLHDFGRSGWWAVGAVVAMLVIMAAGLIAALILYGMDDQRFELVTFIAMLVAGLLQLGITIWLGCVRGDPGPNRFGERTAMRIGRFTL